MIPIMKGEMFLKEGGSSLEGARNKSRSYLKSAMQQGVKRETYWHEVLIVWGRDYDISNPSLSMSNSLLTCS